MTGTKRVRFGRAGKYSYKIANTGTVPCNSGNFGGDPIPNVVKLCQLSTELYTACATEGNTCNFSGTKEVRYGANGQWKTITSPGGVLCSNVTFGGDPLPNVVKTCEYR